MNFVVLGTGIMGAGIAATVACSDKSETVKVWGRSLASLDSAKRAIEKQISRLIRKEKRSQEEQDKIICKLVYTTKLEEFSGVDFLIEAITESKERKIELFSNIRDKIIESTIVASNTSSLSITELAMATNYPNNFIGLHFFNPTSVMQLVEVIKGVTTSEKTLSKSLSLVEDLNKQPVVVNESPGFVVNRMLIPMINEAISILSERVASAADIDKAMVLGANHPIGPLALADLIGNDVCLSIMETLHNETGDPKYRAHPMLRKYVRAGLLGRKTKLGFFKY